MTIATDQVITAEDILNLIASTLTNKSGGAVAAGDVIVFDTANDSAFTTTTYQKDIRVCGVAKDAILNNASGAVYTGAGTCCVVNCDTSAVARGQFLITSSSAKLATGSSYFREAGVFAIALSEKVAGSPGTVTAMLIDNFRQAIIGTAGWAMGGYGPVATTQKFTMANETWSTIPGAALPAAKHTQSGHGYGTVAAYAMHGYNGSAGVATRYKVTFATETSSTLASSTTAKYAQRSGTSFATKGFSPGGFAGSVLTATNLKTAYPTDTETLSTYLSSSRNYQVGVSDGTYAYIAGGTATTTDRLDTATESIASISSAALGTLAEGYCHNSFPATAGYRTYKTGGAGYSRKLVYATATDANHGSAPTGDILKGQSITDGIAYGYCVTTSVNEKLSSSTGTFSSLLAYSVTTDSANASYAAL